LEPDLSAALPDPSPSLIEQDGQGHEIQIADGATITVRILVRGQRNRLLVESGAHVAAFAPAGFAATVPDPSPPTAYGLVIDGDDNLVRIGASARLGLNMTIRGNGNRVEVGERCHLHGFVNVLCGQARLAVGAGTTMVQGSIQLHEPGQIEIGSDCMISSQVYISLSDIHPIYDRITGQRINPAASIHIGDHVWAGLRCMIMKGAQVGEGAILAAGAIVSGDTPSQTIVAGAPARVVRSQVEWRRDFSEAPPVALPADASPAKRRWWRGLGFLRP